MKIVRKVAAIFQRFISMIAARILSDKKFLSAYEKKLNKASKQSTIIKGYKFTLDKIGADAYRRAVAASAVGKYADAKALEDAHDEVGDYIRAKLIGGNDNELTSSEFGKELFSLLRDGEDSPIEITVTASEIIQALKNSDKAKKDASDEHKTWNKAAKDVLKALEQEERDAEKKLNSSDKKDGDERTKENDTFQEAYQLATKVAKWRKDAIGIAAVAFSAKLKAIKDRSFMYKSAASRIVSGMVKESTAYGGYEDSTTVTESAKKVKKFWDDLKI
jgi:hypothetical protein